jgi:hypothetical protein
MLKAGWLKAQRGGAKDKEAWLKGFMEKNRGRWGGAPGFNFFRGGDTDNRGCGGDSVATRTTTTFVGAW